ncbi:uncharacterized protein LOC141534221 [Cotesia typhae]|uniref:uncharacterized protein LOC141534221 n=1 Tax=Cotesia typhae TaxID=2053667 RepID=UPI003D68ED39
MNVLASGFICVLFTCLWIKIDADCTTTHLGLRSDRIFKTGEKMTYNCKEYECEEKGGWTWTTCPQWLHCEEYIGFQPYNYSKPYPDCCGGRICKTAFVQQVAVSSVTEKKVTPDDYHHSRNIYPVYQSSGVVLSTIPSFFISVIFLLIHNHSSTLRERKITVISKILITTILKSVFLQSLK